MAIEMTVDLTSEPPFTNHVVALLTVDQIAVIVADHHMALVPGGHVRADPRATIITTTLTHANDLAIARANQIVLLTR